MKDLGNQNGDHNRLWDRLAWAMIVAGTLLRIARYLDNRSLWLDEILLARNLESRTLFELLKPLDFRQGAPPLFLLLEKLTINLFGHSELAMRAIPLLAGIASLPLLWLIARQILTPRCALIAVTTLAVIEPAIYYSSELKQYSTDLLTTLLLWQTALRYQQSPTRPRLTALFGMGVAAIYFSHPAIFVLAAILLSTASRRPPVWLAIGLAIAFLPNYWLFLRPLSRDGGLQAYWADAFMPWSTSAIPWAVTALWGLFADYATMWITGPAWPSAYPIAAMCAATLGTGALARRSGRMALLVSGPIVMAIGAAAIHAYPFSGRLLLFLIPVPIVLMAAVFLPPRPGDRFDAILFNIARAVVILAVLVPSAARAAKFLIRPPGREEIRPVVAELAKRVHPGDTVYVYHSASAGFRYYGTGYDWSGIEVIEGRNRDEDVTAFEQDVPELIAREQVWILFSHTPAGTSSDARFVALFPQNARVLKSIEARGAGAYLYDLKGGPAAN